MTLHCESEKEFLEILKVKVAAGKALTTDRHIIIQDGDVRIAIFAPEEDQNEN